MDVNGMKLLEADDIDMVVDNLNLVGLNGGAPSGTALDCQRDCPG